MGLALDNLQRLICHETQLYSLTNSALSLINTHILVNQLAGAIEYTDCTSAEGVRPLPNECLGMTQINLMVMFQ